MSSKKNFPKLISISVVLAFVVAISVCKRHIVQTVVTDEESAKQSRELMDEPIQPIPTDIQLDAGKVALGEKLFNDSNLSDDNTVSCSSCHSLELGGTDHRTYSLGIRSRVGSINSPTVFNAAYNFKQFWDGRTESLEDQIEGPTHSPKEMGASWEEI